MNFLPKSEYPSHSRKGFRLGEPVLLSGDGGIHWLGNVRVTFFREAKDVRM